MSNHVVTTNELMVAMNELVEFLQENMATKEDLKELRNELRGEIVKCATKEDLAREIAKCAKKEDLDALRNDLMRRAQKEDLRLEVEIAAIRHKTDRLEEMVLKA